MQTHRVVKQGAFFFVIRESVGNNNSLQATSALRVTC